MDALVNRIASMHGEYRAPGRRHGIDDDLLAVLLGEFHIAADLAAGSGLQLGNRLCGMGFGGAAGGQCSGGGGQDEKTQWHESSS